MLDVVSTTISRKRLWDRGGRCLANRTYCRAREAWRRYKKSEWREHVNGEIIQLMSMRARNRRRQAAKRACAYGEEWHRRKCGAWQTSEEEKLMACIRHVACKVGNVESRDM